jgi:hypothetical protein
MARPSGRSPHHTGMSAPRKPAPPPVHPLSPVLAPSVAHSRPLSCCRSSHLVCSHWQQRGMRERGVDEGIGEQRAQFVPWRPASAPRRPPASTADDSPRPTKSSSRRERCGGCSPEPPFPVSSNLFFFLFVGIVMPSLSFALYQSRGPLNMACWLGPPSPCPKKMMMHV